MGILKWWNSCLAFSWRLLLSLVLLSAFASKAFAVGGYYLDKAPYNNNFYSSMGAACSAVAGTLNGDATQATSCGSMAIAYCQSPGWNVYAWVRYSTQCPDGQTFDCQKNKCLSSCPDGQEMDMATEQCGDGCEAPRVEYRDADGKKYCIDVNAGGAGNGGATPDGSGGWNGPDGNPLTSGGSSGGTGGDTGGTGGDSGGDSGGSGGGGGGSGGADGDSSTGGSGQPPDTTTGGCDDGFTLVAGVCQTSDEPTGGQDGDTATGGAGEPPDTTTGGCDQGLELVNGICRVPCDGGFTVSGVCTSTTADDCSTLIFGDLSGDGYDGSCDCPATKDFFNGQCLAQCADGETRDSQGDCQSQCDKGFSWNGSYCTCLSGNYGSVNSQPVCLPSSTAGDGSNDGSASGSCPSGQYLVCTGTTQTSCSCSASSTGNTGGNNDGNTTGGFCNGGSGGYVLMDGSCTCLGNVATIDGNFYCVTGVNSTGSDGLALVAGSLAEATSILNDLGSGIGSLNQGMGTLNQGIGNLNQGIDGLNGSIDDIKDSINSPAPVNEKGTFDNSGDNQEITALKGEISAKYTEIKGGISSSFQVSTVSGSGSLPCYRNIPLINGETFDICLQDYSEELSIIPMFIYGMGFVIAAFVVLGGGNKDA